MAKISGNYEVVYIIDPALGEEAIADTVSEELKESFLEEENADDGKAKSEDDA